MAGVSGFRLVHGQLGLDAAAGFQNQAEVLVNTRGAADTVRSLGDGVGPTKMDRPEWIAVHGETRDVYCALTNNMARTLPDGDPLTPPLPTDPDAPNPRAKNAYGHILRWREASGDPRATHFKWDIFVLCGDPDLHPDPADPGHGTIQGDKLGSPDGLWFDRRGVLWIQPTFQRAS